MGAPCPPTLGGLPGQFSYVEEPPVRFFPRPQPAARPIPVRPAPVPVQPAPQPFRFELPPPDSLGIALAEALDLPAPDSLGISIE